MKTIFAFILGTALGFIDQPVAHAEDVFVEVGQSNFQKQPDGIWWQGQYPSVFDLDSTYFRIGVESASGWRVSYVNLGAYRTQALATVEEDRYFSGACDVKTCKAPDKYQTDGAVQGFLFSRVFRHTYGYVEAGGYFGRQTFELNARGIAPGSHFMATSIYPGPPSEYGHYRFTGRKFGLGYMLGAGLEYGRATLSANFFRNDKTNEFEGVGGFPGVDTVTAVAVGYRF